MVYLLHFAEPIGQAHHYLGATKDGNLKARLYRHACGTGAALTCEAVKRRIPMYLVRTFPEFGFAEEREMKKRGRYVDLCPMCCPLTAPADPEPYRINPDRPHAPPPRAILGWTT